MPKIDLDDVQTAEGSRYPSPFDQPCRDRKRWRVSDAIGISQFGVHVVRLGPGAWSTEPPHGKVFRGPSPQQRLAAKGGVVRATVLV